MLSPSKDIQGPLGHLGHIVDLFKKRVFSCAIPQEHRRDRGPKECVHGFCGLKYRRHIRVEDDSNRAFRVVGGESIRFGLRIVEVVVLSELIACGFDRGSSERDRSLPG